MKKSILIIAILIITNNLFAKQTTTVSIDWGVAYTLNGKINCSPFAWVCNLTVTQTQTGIYQMTNDNNILTIKFKNDMIPNDIYQKYFTTNSFNFNCDNKFPYYELSTEITTLLSLPKGYKIYPKVYNLDKSINGFTTIIIK